MPVPPGTFRLDVVGTMPGGENFSWGWWARGGGDNAATAAVFAANVLADSDFTGFLAVCRSLANAGTRYLSLRSSRYGASGHVDDSAVVSLGSDAAPGSGAVPHPNYTALCVTLRDGLAGASHRNRFYLPANGISLGADGTLPAFNLNQVATAAAAYYVSGTPVVLSLKNGTYQVVTKVTMDSRMDTQRGRNESTAAVQVSKP